ncbi:hypothetical protein TMEN_911 [Trichophyton mentagrophytes]|nr:hypothetical protein TMEN_911 [Trichophyton mentagrophytes]
MSYLVSDLYPYSHGWPLRYLGSVAPKSTRARAYFPAKFTTITR